ncbi:MAG: type II toxin-antitoxin system PemK/MazF family toxin [bacterium]|nr:type II toxin-antitoxin system PemK/MazF family toxin [bacterium]
MKIEQGAIFLINFPFTSLRAHKLRPALIVSGSRFNRSQDVIVAGITTQVGTSDFVVPLEEADLVAGVLRKKSFVKCGRLVAIEKDLLLQPVGILKGGKLQKVLQEIKSILEE